MKSAEEYAKALSPGYEGHLDLEDFILAIQRDAIQAAAGKCKHLADETESNSDGDPFDDGFGAGANRCSEIILSLLPEAKT